MSERGAPNIRFGLSALEAAEAIGVSMNTFLAMVEEGRMPKPRAIRSRRIWDVDEVREAFKAIPHAGQAADGEGADTWADLQA